MLNINDLKNGSLVLIDGAPYEVLEIKHLHMGRGGSSVQTRIRNIKTGQVFSRNYKPSDQFEEANVEKKKFIFLYGHRGNFVFTPAKESKNRFTLTKDKLGEKIKWLKPNLEVEAVFSNEEIIDIKLPIKVDYEVKEAPPGIQGDRSQAGTKSVVIETEAVIQAPLFINTGDVIRINTETGEYVERVSKV